MTERAACFPTPPRGQPRLLEEMVITRAVKLCRASQPRTQISLSQSHLLDPGSGRYEEDIYISAAYTGYSHVGTRRWKVSLLFAAMKRLVWAEVQGLNPDSMALPVYAAPVRFRINNELKRL